ncbi:MAG: metallophosphoesterase [Clostridia bacterium]|nr:metallophosphoesterase [Clostridia bacterium]
MALSFLAFADFHYKQGMYASTVADLQAILDRAVRENAAFILHAGDFCNDYPASPEVTELLLQNPYGIAVYGCCGNHELETAGTSMSFVSSKLTNREVVWGSADGKSGDGNIGHYYFDHGDHRIVVTDTNYSLNPAGFWEHNRTGSYGPPRDNNLGDSLGPDQLGWLECVLTDAAKKQLRCIVLSHASFDNRNDASPDASAVRDIFSRANALRVGTVTLAINGHYHTDGCKVEEGVVYFDVNAARNTWWDPTPHGKYGEDTPTFPYTEYDENGTPLGDATARPLLSLSQGKRTLFTEAPLCAMVTVDGGTVTIRGTVSRWVGNLAPDTDRENIRPEIRDWKVQAVK